jgi:hypothetical protein
VKARESNTTAGGPTWLAGLAGAALLVLASFTALVRGESTAEGYALATCEQEASSLSRRMRVVHTDILDAFARWDRAADTEGALR